METDEEELTRIAELVNHRNLHYHSKLTSSQIQKGVSSARSDDTKSLKGPIVDWITSSDQPLRPLLARNVKMDRGFHHEQTGALLCPVELDWSDPESVHLSVLRSDAY